MNVYDAANQLAKELRESHEYKKLLSAKEALGKDQEAEKMVRDFLGKQAQLQIDAMSGKELDKGKQEQLQKLYEVIALNSDGREYMQVYMRFQLMLEDIYKILGDAVKPALGEAKDA
jgi:cell fate (sporulation/competence/biofilm development) regulator YlbF (YheA/YmcA/DUF963 family)